MSGRCWSSAGGTLNADGTRPGPYYTLAAADVAQVGSAGTRSSDLLERAVAYGVIAIQRALNRRLVGTKVAADGVFGEQTYNACVAFQQQAHITADGAVGPQTVKPLFYPDMLAVGTKQAPGCLILGFCQAESNLDPGAVGFADSDDKGIGQQNIEQNDLTEEEAFSVLLTLKGITRRVRDNTKALDGNKDAAIAAYNLGVGGARTWIDRGSPNIANWYDPPRDVRGYINKIQANCPS